MAKEKSTFWSDFKAFIAKGNVLDMAVGVVVGSAFGKITTSLVNDIIMPPIGLLIGNVDFSQLKVVLKEAEGETAAVAINYGAFIQTILDFLLIALCIFVAVRVVTKAQKKLDEFNKQEMEKFGKLKEEKAAEEQPAPAPAPVESEEVKLLREIRDSLKKD